ncbi:MAG TPA: aminotransferase class I/II-fold pyridoxal phosphate-dependent enzyme [bacterium]|nr:aminotransferase class I/II-fold pyridoxal phosphate-dependent enzyme [bacterium]
MPALDAFPFDVWRRLAARRSRRPPRDLTAYGEPAGYRPLRNAIAAYVTATRAAHCIPDQVLIVEGSQQALDLAARVLLDPGDGVWFEEPGYWGVRRAFHTGEVRLVPVPVDDGGLNVEAGIARCRAAPVSHTSRHRTSIP